MINSTALKGIRKRKGLTQQELAVRAGITRGMVAKYETNAADPTLQTAYKIAQVLEIQLEEIVAPNAAEPDLKG